jgi:mono/diheme cytochrome c family protein
MARSIPTLRFALVVGLVGAFLLAACGGATPAPPTASEAEHMETQAEEPEHEEEAEHEEEDAHGPDEHMAGTGHDVPEEAAEVPNPIEASDESIEAGAGFYAASCAVCHGETGEGDGPGAEGLENKPADLHEGHVQENSDGALFYIISHGRPDTPMPAWEDVLSEEERWHVVNFLRTFSE